MTDTQDKNNVLESKSLATSKEASSDQEQYRNPETQSLVDALITNLKAHIPDEPEQKAEAPYQMTSGERRSPESPEVKAFADSAVASAIENLNSHAPKKQDT